jgi:hypothetical protein
MLSVDDAERAWAASRAAILTPPTELATLASLVDAFRRLERWRLRAARARPEGRVPAFVAACGQRLVIADAASQAGLVVQGAESLCASFAPPESTAAVIQLVRAGSWAWNVAPFEAWGPVAYAVCFAEEEEVTVDEAFLGVCAAFDVECALRGELRRVLSLGEGLRQPPDERRPAALAWASRMMHNANDDVFALSREAHVWAFLTPNAERKGEGAPSVRLAAWDPERAGQVTAEAAAPEGVLFLFLFDYVMRQTLDVRFLETFFAADYDSGRALDKVETLKRERLRNPPALVVHSLGDWALVHRAPDAPELGRVLVYETALDATLAWMDDVMHARGGRMFLGRRLDELYADVTRIPEERVTRLVASTEAVGW